MYKLLILYALLVSIDMFCQSDTNRILSHLKSIVETEKPRNFKNVEMLDQTAEYIYKDFLKSTDSVSFQNYSVDLNDKIYKNVIASFGCENDRRIIIGAHYDVCGNQDGADDNATGVVGLLEISTLLKDVKLNYRIDIVAYSLEEPPFFRTNYMGSYIHAKYLKDNDIDVYGMICLEMIGYFSDEKHSQSYPLSGLSIVYGNKGDYITVVSKMGRGDFARNYKRKMKKSKLIKTKGFKGPSKLQGIDFSDHLNYWGFGYDAVMITNTGFYRNPNYHQTTDRIETLNIPKMSRTIDAVFETILFLSEENSSK